MKYYISSIILAAGIILISCAKTRTCSCKYENTTTNVTTPRISSVAPSTNVSTDKGESNNTYDNIKKKEMKRIMDCNSRTETATRTYTSSGTVVVQTPTVIFGVTFTVPVVTNYTSDVSSTTTWKQDCEIK